MRLVVLLVLLACATKYVLDHTASFEGRAQRAVESRLERAAIDR
jgi:hypothetical protein